MSGGSRSVFIGRAETIFAVGNGCIGMRGTFEEGRPALAPDTFVAGFHETWMILHAEEAYGLARSGHTLVNVSDATVVELYVESRCSCRPRGCPSASACWTGPRASSRAG